MIEASEKLGVDSSPKHNFKKSKNSNKKSRKKFTKVLCN